jgi:2-dehydropantoate 2-reductase
VDVLVFGAGAVGLGLASALGAAGAELRLVGRPATVAALRRHGLRRTGIFGEVHVAPARLAAAETVDALPGGAAAFALVATKAFDSDAAAAALAGCPRVVGARTQIVLCQNGWGNAERFAPLFGRERIWNARVITGFRRPAPHHVDLTVHAEPVRIGSLAGRDPAPLRPLAEAIARGGLPCETTRDVAADLWAKLLYNAVLNPPGALLGVPYGELGASPHLRELLDALARETFSAMRAAGQRTHWASASDWLETFYAKLLPPTAPHESSMLQDLRAGRRTEIDAITGEVVRLAEVHGVDVPVSRAMLALVRFAEERQRGRHAPDGVSGADAGALRTPGNPPAQPPHAAGR